MISIRRICTPVILGAIAFSSHAATLVPNLTIRGVVAGWNGEGIYVDVDQSIGSQQTGFNCPATNRFYIPTTSPMYKENVSMILAAYSLGSSVDFAVADCQLSAIRFVAVQMHK